MDHLLRAFNDVPRGKGSLKQELLWMADERVCCYLITVNTEVGYPVARRVLEPYNVDPGWGRSSYPGIINTHTRTANRCCVSAKERHAE